MRQDRKPVLGGEHHVEDHQVRRPGGQKGKSLLTRRGVPDLVSLGFEQTNEQTSDLGVVIDDHEPARLPRRGRESLSGLSNHARSVVTAFPLGKPYEGS